MGKEILYERAENMRYNPTKSEREFRDLLEINNINYKQQFVIGKYIADFLINKTVVEIDGASHYGREIYDAERDLFIRAKGYKVIRILNSEVKSFDVNRLKGGKKKGEVVNITGSILYELNEKINTPKVKNERQPSASSGWKHHKFMKKYKQSYK